MKKLILVLLVMAGCGGMNNEQKEKDLKDSLEEIKIQNINLKAKLNSLTKTNYLDSLSEINAIKEILGEYESNEQYYVQYAAADIPGGPTMIIQISQLKDKIIFKQVYTGDVPYGCDGPHTEASAEILEIEKIDSGIYKMKVKKLKCQFTNSDVNCENKEVLEKNFNIEFSLSVKLKKKTEITFHSNATKTKCTHAWDFTGLTFIKK